MSNRIPEGWKIKQLGEVATLQRGYDLPISMRQRGNIPVYGSNGIDGWHNKYKVSGPGVITGRSGSIGFVHLENRNFWPLNTTLYVRDFHGNHVQFVAQLLESINLQRFSASTGVPSLNRNFVHPTPVLIPPVEEQERIAKIVNAANEAISKTKRLIKKLNAIKKGFIRGLLTCGLDRKGQLRDPKKNPKQFKKSIFGSIPTEWGTFTINDLAIYVGSGITPTGGSNVYKSEGVLFIRSQNVTFEGLQLNEVAYIDERTHKMMSRSEVFSHDVLLNITGASIGRCCPVPEDIGPANVNQHVCAIRLARARNEDATFLSTALSSSIGQKQIIRMNAGSNRQGLNYQQIRSFEIPWPNNDDERSMIAERLETYNYRIKAEKAYLSKLKSIKKGLMQDLMVGRIRV